MTVFLQQTATGPELVTEIQASYFTDSDADRFITAFQRGLKFLQMPDTPLKAVTAPVGSVVHGPALPIGERTIAGRLRAQAGLTPDATALRFGDQSVTYAEMIARANSVAAGISAKIATPKDAVVGLYMAPSIDHIASIVALAQLNITILPLDPSYPDALLDAIVAKAAPAQILASQAPERPAINGQPITQIPIAAAPAAPPPAHHGNPLYLLFTSGSTGAPKGVRVYDDTMCNLLNWQMKMGDLGDARRTQQFSKLSFDVSFQEILTTLTTGGTLDLLTPPLRHDMVALLHAMRQQRSARIFLPFIALKLLAETALATGITLPDMRQVITAGEELLCTREIRNWFKTMPDARLINHYGPSETHVVSAFTLPLSPDDWPDAAPIGLPIANITFGISDEDQLLISGPMIRECYLDAADNATRFLTSDGVQYQSGDRVKLQRNSVFKYLGRVDGQIKFSGHRLELQQVEAVVNKHPGVSLCIMRLTEDHELIGFAEFVARPLSLQEINAHLATALPDYVRLHALYPVTKWPRTPSGKLDRKALVRDAPITTQVMDQPDDVVTQLAGLFFKTLGRAIEPSQTFTAAGANSLDLMKFRNAVQRQYKTHIAVADLFGDATTIDRLAGLLTASGRPKAEDITPAKVSTGKIAIVGMAVNLPGAANLGEFSKMIANNQTGITHFDVTGDKIGAKSQMQDLLGFDPAYFGISRHDAALMDPQQRHLLMNALHVLQDAGVDPARSTDRIGIIASCGENTYFQDMLRHADPESLPDSFQLALHHDKDFLATKLAYRLGLIGPALSVQAACGSSLIGVHTAAGMLRNGECDAMLVGASLVDASLSDGYTYRAHHIFSKDGYCRPFDKDASGTIGASGCGFVMLKPLEQAQKDGNKIYCVLEGSAVNNDGSDKMSYTAPSATGQRAVLAAAVRNSGLSGADIGYIEAHGTGTALGDPIEVAAIDAVYGDRTYPLALSSVKSQIGHLGAAAGIVGLIRAALAIRLQVYPPNLNYRTPNPELGLEQRKMFVPPTAQPWIDERRRAGISSFGIGGTNAHVIIGEVNVTPAPQRDPAQILLLSAQSETSLKVWAKSIATYLEQNPDRAPDLRRFLQNGTVPLRHRCGFVWRDTEDAIRQLRAPEIHSAETVARHFDSHTETPETALQLWLDGQSPRSNGKPAPAPEGLPLYPFDLAPFTFEHQKPHAGLTRLPPEQWLSQPVWVSLGTVPQVTDAPESTAIVLCDPAQTHDLGQAYNRVIYLHLADQFAELGPDRFNVTTDPRDFANISVNGPADILNLLPMLLPELPDSTAMEQAQTCCLDVVPGLVTLAKRHPNNRLLHVSIGAAALNGQIKRPLATLLSGAAHVVPLEQGIATFWLDFAEDSIRLLPQSLRHTGLTPGRYGIANGQFWRADKVPANPPDTARRPDNRRYVVVGGTGGIGRNICQQILHGTENTIEIIAHKGSLPGNLRAYADRITLHHRDLTDSSLIWPEFSGPVSGVIFAAGLGSYAPIAQRDPATLRDLNRVRANGALALETLICREQPETVVYCSSMASLMGGRGQLDYSATNGLLDGMAQWTNPAAPATRRSVINWDIWAESGMAVTALVNDTQHQDHLKFGLSDAEGRSVFAQAMTLARPQLLVSTVALDQAERFYGNTVASDPVQIDVNPATHIAMKVGKLLGLSAVAADQPLGELGLDSIAMIDLLAEIKDTFDAELGLSTITAEMSSSDIAALVDAQRPAQPGIRELAGLVAAALGQDSVDPEQTFGALGIDSLCAIDLMEQITRNYHVPLAVSDFGDTQTVTGLWAHITDCKAGNPASAMTIKVDQWQKGTGAQRAICFIHPVGGETASYKPLLGKISGDITVLAIADPNLSLADPQLLSLPERARHYLDALASELDFTTTKVELVGWSFGAWVAQQMAVQGWADGTNIAHLTMIDPPEPDSGPNLGTYTKDEIQAAFLHDLLPRLSEKGTAIRPLETRIAPEIQNHLDRIVQCCELNMNAMRLHRPAPLAGTFTRVFVAAQTADGLLLEPISAEAHHKKWSALIANITYSATLAANHYTIMYEPAINLIAEKFFDTSDQAALAQ